MFAPKKTLSVLICLSFLAGCAAAGTSVAKRNLDVQTRMSETIFLNPVSPSQRTIYVEVRNTSDKPDFTVEDDIKGAIQARGYRIVNDPDRAQFLLQANVLQAGRNSETAAERASEGGFGSVLTGGAIGAGAGKIGGIAGGNDTGLIIGGAILGAAASSLAGALVQDVTYTVITDIQVSERTAGGTIVSRTETRDNKQGTTGDVFETSSETSDWKRHRSRIVATANKANLDWPEAAPFMVDGLERSIAGLF